MAAFTQEPVAIITATEARMLWQAAKLRDLHRRVAGEESNPLYQTLTTIYRAILAAQPNAAPGIETRHEAASEEREWWTVQQLARATGLSTRKIRLDAQQGRVPATKHSGTWLVSDGDATTYIESTTPRRRTA